MTTRTLTHRHLLASVLAVTAAGVALAGVPLAISSRGWQPLVALAGDGNPQSAVAGLTVGSQTVGAVLRDLRVSTETRTFLGSFVDSLSTFDLQGFHDLLPERNGPWKSIRVIGKVDGAGYRLGRASSGEVSRVSPHGPLGKRPGDLGMELRTRRLKVGDAQHYLLRSEFGLGVGGVSWGAIVDGVKASARLGASGDPYLSKSPRASRPGKATRLRLLETHPTLRPEDTEVLGVLFEAFPRLSDLFLDVGRVDDVLVFDVKGDGSVQQLRLKVRLVPDVLRVKHPELAEFLEGIGPLVKTQATWVDAKRRQLARFGLDTTDLAVTFECFVSDGSLVPVSNGRALVGVAAAAPITCRVDLASQLNGIETRISGMQVAWSYTGDRDSADMTARITQVPAVTVSGNAYGFLPTWAIDVLIPGDIDTLTRELLGAACHGNDGRGIELTVAARQAQDSADGAATITGSAGIQVLDSTLIQLGMKIASLKLIPDAEVRDDLHALLVEAHTAFDADLRRFSGLAR